jgi:hypothetical protein
MHAKLPVYLFLGLIGIGFIVTRVTGRLRTLVVTMDRRDDPGKFRTVLGGLFLLYLAFGCVLLILW